MPLHGLAGLPPLVLFGKRADGPSVFAKDTRTERGAKALANKLTLGAELAAVLPRLYFFEERLSARELTFLTWSTAHCISSRRLMASATCCRGAHGFGLDCASPALGQRHCRHLGHSMAVILA
jgi:hypothetical protein